MQDDKIMFLEKVKQTARRRREMWITPCKPTGAARGKRNHRSANQPRSGLNSYRSSGVAGVSHFPELHFACTGLSIFASLPEALSGIY